MATAVDSETVMMNCINKADAFAVSFRSNHCNQKELEEFLDACGSMVELTESHRDAYKICCNSARSYLDDPDNVITGVQYASAYAAALNLQTYSRMVLDVVEDVMTCYTTAYVEVGLPLPIETKALDQLNQLFRSNCVDGGELMKRVETFF